MTKLRGLSEVFDAIYGVGSYGVLDFRMLVGAEWVSLEQRIEVRSPVDDDTIATIPSASEQEAEKAVKTSYVHRNSIRTVPAVRKIEIFEEEIERQLFTTRSCR